VRASEILSYKKLKKAQIGGAKALKRGLGVVLRISAWVVEGLSKTAVTPVKTESLMVVVSK